MPRLGAGLGRLRSQQPEEPPPALLAAGRAQHAPSGGTRVLVDTSPDLREQLLDAEVDRLDAVLFTHEHADHTHGIDDLRGARSSTSAGASTSISTSRPRATCTPGSAIASQTPPGSEYPPILTEHRMVPGQPVRSRAQGGTIAALPFLQDHGDIASLGFRFGDLAYSCDLQGPAGGQRAGADGLDVWIVDALRYRPHPSHFSVAEALAWIERLKPRARDPDQPARRSRLRGAASRLPAHVEPAYRRACYRTSGPLILA